MAKRMDEETLLKRNIMAHNEMLARMQKNRDQVQGNIVALTERLIKLQAAK